MNKPPRYHAALVLGAGLLLMAGAYGLSWRLCQKQEALNRQLIEALMKGDLPQKFNYHYDDREALALVNAGADPNTPLLPFRAPSMRQRWNYVIHRAALPVNDSPSAFLIACGAWWTKQNKMVLHGGEDLASVRLAKSMLEHGAHINTTGERGWTALMYAAYQHNETLDFLIEHNVNINATDEDGDSALLWAVIASDMSNEEVSKSVIMRLLAHGADPNQTDKNGNTSLQLAQLYKRSDLVAILKQAGAKK